ncbi:MAG: hypothetical protein RMJ54_15825 [Roseiflexaceae bacterium]|nr:hypothetical protein [Roseiflexaceae bacterium]
MQQPLLFLDGFRWAQRRALRLFQSLALFRKPPHRVGEEEQHEGY